MKSELTKDKIYSKNSLDIFYAHKDNNESCVNWISCINCKNCEEIIYSVNCENLQNGLFCRDLKLDKKDPNKYYLFNKEVPKDIFEEKVEKLQAEFKIKSYES